MIINGPFEITMNADPPYDVVDGVSLGHVRFEKRFSGSLDATSQMHFIGARTPVDGSAGYVGLERITGTLSGKQGTFVLQHSGVMTRGAASLSVTVVPDSGTGELKGLSGHMTIQNVQGKHSYEFDFELAAPTT